MAFVPPGIKKSHANHCKITAVMLLTLQTEERQRKGVKILSCFLPGLGWGLVSLITPDSWSGIIANTGIQPSHFCHCVRKLLGTNEG